MTELGWVVVELTYKAERENPEQIHRLLTRALQNRVEVFVPGKTYERRGAEHVIWTMEGYAFIRAGLTPGEYFDLERFAVIEQVLALREANARTLNYVRNEVIEDLKHRLEHEDDRAFTVGDVVLITGGHYSKLHGQIIEINEDTKMVEVQILGLRSIQTVAAVPFGFIDKPLPEDE